MSVYLYDPGTEQEKEYTIVISCENVPGVTASIANLIGRRGINITSLIGASTADPDLYRVIIKCITTSRDLEKMVKQINNIVNVLEVRDSLREEFLEYEMMLARVPYDTKKHNGIFHVVNHFQGKILDFGDKQITLSFSDTPEKLAMITKLLAKFGELEIVMSGVAVMGKQSY